MYFNIEVEHELIHEFLEQLDNAFQEAEGLLISIERSEFQAAYLETIKSLFEQLWISSTKLNLIPLSESLDNTVQMLELLLKWNYCSPRMAECLLLLMDRIHYLAKDIERSMVIDMRETQNILVSLQHIILNTDIQQLDAAVELAYQAITQNITLNTIDTSSEFGVDLFSDDSTVELFDVEEIKPDITVPEIEIFIPEVSNDPLQRSRDTIKEIFVNEPIMLLAAISDGGEDHQDSHTKFLLELGLALNFMAGEPVSTLELAQGICLHDIALASIPHILNKTEKLTTEELDQIRQHPVRGAKLVEAMRCSEDALLVVLQHHERVDGRGYPSGLNGEQISDAGKLAAIIDSFHAMINQRPHKKFTRSSIRAIAEINACVDTHYDKSWIKLFNILMKQYWLPSRRGN